jgi:hypothetical protein
VKASHILCALLACAPLTCVAGAAARSDDGRTSTAAANVGEAAGRAAPSRNAGTKPERKGDRGSNQAGARTGSGSKVRDAAVADSSRRGSVSPQLGAGKVGMGQAGRGNADRPHSMLNTQARGHLARQRGGPDVSARGAAGGPDVHGPQRVSPAGQPKLAASNGGASPVAVPAGQSKLAANSAASPAARLAATPSYSAIGGPHAQVLGRVGGPAISRTIHSPTIDGTRLRHR